MALTNYTTLKASIADWLHRSDLTDVIPDFVTLLESRLNRLLHLRLMETDASLTTAVGQSYAVAPTDMIEPLAVYINWGNGKRQIQKVAPEDLPYGTAQTSPDYWAVDGANILFADPINSTSDYTLTIRYRQKLAIATPTTAATWLLTNHPDIYLYGSLLEAMPYIAADSRLTLWQDRFDRARREVEAYQAHSQQTTSTVDTALQAGGGAIRERIFSG